MPPAVGQGALALQVRADDAEAVALVAAVGHAPTERATPAQRALEARPGGGWPGGGGRSAGPSPGGDADRAGCVRHPGGGVVKPGEVWLVGAGPGDPGLITLAGLERIREADVIVYDRLGSPRPLEDARAHAELVYVGKIPHTVI